MSNKRAVARELKQKKKQQKQLAVIVFSVIALAVIGIFAAYGYGLYSRSYIMVYEGEKIDTTDFQFSLMSSSGSEDAKASGLDLLLDFLTLEKRAQDEGIVLTDEEKSSALQSATQMKSLYSQLGMDFSFIDNERMAELLTRDNYYTHLLEKYTADYTVDEADFAAQLADYKENQKAAYYNINMKYINNTDKAIFDEGVAKLTADNFDETAKEYSTTYSEENGVAEIALKDMYTDLPEGAADKIMALKPGERSEPLVLLSGQNIIFEVISSEIPTDAEVETAYREQYTNEKKTEMFNEILTGWIGEANYELNQRAYDAL